MYTAQKLQSKINQVIRTFPWYEKQLDLSKSKQAAPRPSGSSESLPTSIDVLPLMTADLLNQTYYTQTPKPGLHVYRTSGTGSGKRKVICYSDADEQQYKEIKKRVFSKLLNDSSCTRVVSDVGTGHAASTASRIFTELGMQCRTISFDRPIDEHLTLLRQFQPEVLYTMPSILDRLIVASSDPAAYGIKKIILVGEIASKKWQQQIAQAFQIAVTDIFDTVGSIEMGTIAYFSHEHDRYVLVDGLFGEGVQPEAAGLHDTTLRDDESILVLTSWVREQFPALRFVTYDVVRDFRTMEIDGKLRQTFQAIVKRVGNEWKHGEKISIYDIEEVVYRYVDKVRIKISVVDNALRIELIGTGIHRNIAATIGSEIERKIPEIGMLIQGGLLKHIQVSVSESSKETEADRTSIKGKKLY